MSIADHLVVTFLSAQILILLATTTKRVWTSLHTMFFRNTEIRQFKTCITCFIRLRSMESNGKGTTYISFNRIISCLWKSTNQYTVINKVRRHKWKCIGHTLKNHMIRSAEHCLTGILREAEGEEDRQTSGDEGLLTKLRKLRN